jgi:hypothetical protein
MPTRCKRGSLAEILSRNAETLAPPPTTRFKLHGTTADHDTFKSVDLCVETLVGEDVLALREIGVFDRSN